MTRKIIYVLLLYWLPFSYGFAQPSWQKIKSPTDFNLLKVVYLDSLHCWAAGDSGIMMFSSDQGLTWIIQNSGVSNFISDICFINEYLGWALTFEIEGINFDIRSKILKTTNGGNIWDIIDYRHLNVYLNSVFFKDSLNGWLATKGNGIASTTDGGFNWTEAYIDTLPFANFPIEKIKFSSNLYGFAVGGQVDNVGVAWSTFDGGLTWTPHGIGPDLFLDFIFIDSTTAIALTAELEGFYPTAVLNFNLLDNTWEYFDTSEYVFVTGLSLRTNTEIWGTTSSISSSFIFSKNSGTAWQLINSPETPNNSIVNDVDFADSLHGIAVCNDGFILRYIHEKPVSVENSNLEMINNFILKQNYPNPFNPVTTIKYTIPTSPLNHSPYKGEGNSEMLVTLKVYTMLGKEVATLVNEEQPAGSYEVEFSTTGGSVSGGNTYNLPSGIYFYQLSAGDPSTSSGQSYIETKKMILLK